MGPRSDGPARGVGAWRARAAGALALVGALAAALPTVGPSNRAAAGLGARAAALEGLPTVTVRRATLDTAVVAPGMLAAVESTEIRRQVQRRTRAAATTHQKVADGTEVR